MMMNYDMKDDGGGGGGGAAAAAAAAAADYDHDDRHDYHGIRWCL